MATFILFTFYVHLFRSTLHRKFRLTQIHHCNCDIVTNLLWHKKIPCSPTLQCWPTVLFYVVSDFSTLGRTASGSSTFNLSKARLSLRPQLLLWILRSLLLANDRSHRWQFEPSAMWSCWWCSCNLYRSRFFSPQIGQIIAFFSWIFSCIIFFFFR